MFESRRPDLRIELGGLDTLVPQEAPTLCEGSGGEAIQASQWWELVIDGRVFAQ